MQGRAGGGASTAIRDGHLSLLWTGAPAWPSVAGAPMTVGPVARASDAGPAIALDAAHAGPTRAALLERACADARLWTCQKGGRAAGFLVLDRFFERPFIALLIVAPEHRRCGIASALMAHVEAHAEGEVWTSTNLSNAPAIALFRARGYHAMGQIHGLDPGDPEVVFRRPLDDAPSPPAEDM